MTLWLDDGSRAVLADLARDAYPGEACGLLVGRSVPGGTRVARATSAANLAAGRSRDRFRLDPRDWLLCEREALRDGLEVVGVWHSHPDAGALPSGTDRLSAWSGWSYVIASVDRRGLRGLRSFRFAEGRFVEETVAGVSCGGLEGP